MKRSSKDFSYVNISNGVIAGTVSMLFSLLYLKFSILPSTSFNSLAVDAPPYFNDDRDGWLAFSDAFPNLELLKTLSWQLNFWPPGNIGILTVGKIITGSLFFGAIFHVLLVASIQATLTYQCVSIFSKRRNALPLILMTTILFHTSFIFRSSFIDTVLNPDYLASICLALGLLICYRYFFEDYQNKFAVVVAASAFALSGYLRVTTYQLTLIAFILLSLTRIVLFIRKKRVNQIFRKSLTITLITLILFSPWIIYRSVVIYDNDLSRGLQFSAQARFALSHQWDTPSDFEKNPSLKLMGLGTACAIDRVKCDLLAERQNQILAGTLAKTIDDEWDLRSREAIKTLLWNPVAWIDLKLNYFGQSYFQKSVYDSIDTTYHFSIDLILAVFFIPLTLFLLHRIPASLRKLFITIVFCSGLLLALQLLITQSLLRFFLPSLLLIALSFLLAMQAVFKEVNHNESTRGSL